MEKIIDTFDVGSLQFELYKVIAYYMISAIVKTAFVLVTTYFAFLSIVRTCDNNNSQAKRAMFLANAYIGIAALIIFFGWGYNNILVLAFEVNALRYYVKEDVKISILSILQTEWEEDWEPRLQNVLVFFRFLTRH